MQRDDNPFLGAQKRLPSHIAQFLSWADHRHVSTIGRRIESITWSAEEPLLLSGILAFLARREVADILDAWAENTTNRFVSDLGRLSAALATSFPEIPVPSPTQPIQQRLHGRLEDGYLGAMFAARQAPDLEERDQDSLDCLRLWILIKSLDYARAGHAVDGNLYKACTFIRSALDAQLPDRRHWLSRLLTPSRHLHTFEDTLALACKVRPATDDSTQRETRRALLNLVEGNKRKHSFDPGAPHERTSALDWQLWNDIAEGPETDGSLSAGYTSSQGLDHVVLPDGRFFSTPVSTRDNPDRQSAKARRIALQTVEERQFLPCSWFEIRTDEHALLSATINSWLRQPASEYAVTCAFTVLAMVTQGTLESVGALAISAQLETEWTLDLAAGQLKRRASRPGVRWKRDSETREWTKDLADEWNFELQEPLLDTLREAKRKSPEAERLIDLWQFSRTPYAAFLSLCRDTPGLERISSHAIGLIGERRAFVEKGDAVYARLVMAPATAGIAGSGSYPSWPLCQPVRTLESVAGELIESTAHQTDLERNGLGSELDPDDLLLRNAFSEALARLEAANADRHWIIHHNRLTGYVIAALLASTGARPSRSPFESILHIDLENKRIYIEDKATAQMSSNAQGRITPLTDVACVLLSQVYLPYLRSLAEQLQREDKALAAELTLLANGTGSNKMPLFFFLRERPSFAWMEVTESALRDLAEMDWPLPWNLFRHRMATRLRQSGLDPELIDAQLGHAEVGSETFGDASTRCWQEDEPAWRAALERSIAPLDIQVPRLPFTKVKPVERRPGYRPFREASMFGRQARRSEREKNRAEARQQAQREIVQRLGSRPPGSLSQEEWDAIGRSMLFLEGNRPHTNAGIRYEVFDSVVQRLWREKSIRIPLRRRYFRIPMPRSGQEAASLRAHASLAPIKAALDGAFKRPVSLQSVRNAGLLAALDMAITSRVADLKVLIAVAGAERKHMRVAIESNMAYLDYTEDSSHQAAQPARRYLVPARSAPLINKALGAKTKSYQRKEETEDILDILRSASADLDVMDRDSLLAHVARLVDLENSLMFPGVVCAVLSGRTPTYSLSYADWIRAKHGLRRCPSPALPGSVVQVEIDEQSADEPSSDDSDRGPHRTLFTVAPTRSRLDTAAREDARLLEHVRRLLRQLAGERVVQEDGRSLPQRAHLKNANGESIARSATKAAIRDLLKRASPESSMSVRLLAGWAVKLLERKNRRGGGKLRPSSILRYFGALSGGFLSYGRNVDMRTMDESQLTDFYLNVVDSALLHLQTRSSDAQAEVEQALTTDRDAEVEDGEPTVSPGARSTDGKTSQAYVLERVMEFHRFATSIFDLAEPDWSEIGDGLSASTVSPGFITPHEYSTSLAVICPSPNVASIEDLRCAFLLLLTYRFGLRSGEAISLARSDWIEAGGAIVVLVNSTHAAVKTSASKRQVPLLGDLSLLERSIVDAWMVHWQTETRDNRSIPLFFRDPLNGGIAAIEPIRRRLVAILRAVTGAADLTLHKTRHSFANILALNALRPEGLSIWKTAQFPGETPDSPSPLHAQAVIGSQRSTRRRLWAIGRALGHSAPQTTCGSYLHFMGEWCAQEVMQRVPAVFNLHSVEHLDRFTNLDKWIDDQTYLRIEKPPELDAPSTLTPLMAIQYMRAVARGIPSESASSRLNMDPIASLNLHQAILVTAARAKDRSPFEVGRAEELPLRLEYLQGIKPSRWDALMPLVADVKRSGVDRPDEDPLAQLGTGFQILAFKRGHFENVRRFLTDIDWDAESVRFFRPQKLTPLVSGWAEEYGFVLSPTTATDGSKSFQIAVGREYAAHESPAERPHRIGMVRSASNDKVNSQVELATIWLAYWCSQSA